MLRRIAYSAAALMVLAAAPALAADAAKEIATAGAHAGMAAAAADLKMVQAHLHHVLNCLQGPGGRDFDATQANPCQGQGMGAIMDASPDTRIQLENAAMLAKSGLGETDIAKAREDATEAQAALKKAAM